MNTWQALRNWKYYLEFVTGLSLILTAAFFITAMNQSSTTMERQRQADAAFNHIEQAEYELALLAEPSTTTPSSWYLENMSTMYLGPLSKMNEAVSKNQVRINEILDQAEKLQISKGELLGGITQLEGFILDYKRGELTSTSVPDVGYLASISAWLSNLKSALLTGNLDANSLARLNQLTSTMQEEAALTTSLFPAQLTSALSVFMDETQKFLNLRTDYQQSFEVASSSLVGLRQAMDRANTTWASAEAKDQMVLWVACFFGIAMTGFLFWTLFSTKHFNAMLAGTAEQARIIENSEFVHQVDELLSVVDKNWIDSRKESSVLNDTASVNEDIKRNIYQLEHDIKTRNSHEESEFEALMGMMSRLRDKVQSGQLELSDLDAFERRMREMHHNTILDNKSVSDDLAGVENCLYTLNSDMRKLQNLMNHVVQDSRRLLRMRNNIEESEEIIESMRDDKAA